MRTEKHVGTETIVHPRYLSLEFTELEKTNNPCYTRREREKRIFNAKKSVCMWINWVCWMWRQHNWHHHLQEWPKPKFLKSFFCWPLPWVTPGETLLHVKHFNSRSWAFHSAQFFVGCGYWQLLARQLIVYSGTHFHPLSYLLTFFIQCSAVLIARRSQFDWCFRYVLGMHVFRNILRMTLSLATKSQHSLSGRKLWGAMPERPALSNVFIFMV